VKYPNYQDLARWEYARLLWKNPVARRRLLAHWQDPRHPYAERFAERQTRIVAALESELSDEALDQQLQGENLSLRVLIREIPPVFGQFFR
jgi:hypothetical protein